MRGGLWKLSDGWSRDTPFLFNHVSSSRKFGNVVYLRGRRYFTSHRVTLRQKLAGYNTTLLRHASMVVAWMEPDIRLEREGFSHPHKREHERARARMRKTILHEKIRELHAADFSEREIAKVTGAAKTTVHEVVAESDQAKLYCKEKEKKLAATHTARADELLDRFERSVEKIEDSARALERRFPGDRAVSRAVDELLESLPGAEPHDNRS
jgi:hypothetical protein